MINKLKQAIERVQSLIRHFLSETIPFFLATTVYISLVWIILLTMDDKLAEEFFYDVFYWHYDAFFVYVLYGLLILHLIFRPKFRESGLNQIITFLSSLKPHFAKAKGFICKYINFQYFASFKVVIFLKRVFSRVVIFWRPLFKKFSYITKFFKRFKK